MNRENRAGPADEGQVGRDATPNRQECSAVSKSLSGRKGWGGASQVALVRHRFDFWVRKIPWRRAWQPTLVLLPGESHGQMSLVGCSPQACKESDRLK